MSMVIQLSLLCACHEIQSLGKGLETALRLRAGASNTELLPLRHSIRGVLRAVSEQTAGFTWCHYSDEVLARLSVHYNDKYTSVQLTIFRLEASIDMLEIVQRSYKDSIMDINGFSGCVTMVLWAHHVLGLTVSWWSFSNPPQSKHMWALVGNALLIKHPG